MIVEGTVSVLTSAFCFPLDLRKKQQKQAQRPRGFAIVEPGDQSYEESAAQSQQKQASAVRTIKSAWLIVVWVSLRKCGSELWSLLL